ncbi:hypothetical protein O6H91_09G118700 [Diphasiastrum complanatum]|uniref:Uncharacterized protein n=1 Tax=Diphasiastrum complanatum TaxID=34168 RepID=A0ACC2CTV1_DIPCM|nr:hypothetical protein O6H91_09G118700 [Diphasiastrum complanatum]
MLFLSSSVLSSQLHGRNRRLTIQPLSLTRICSTKSIVSVNGIFPGPTLYANEGDRIIVKVTNRAQYNITIHWHGVRQILSGWADGPAYITQCPVQTGQSYVYNYTLTKQSGTLFWHAHETWLRGTVYGPIVIYPQKRYPFVSPYEEHVIILGEWWKANVEDVETAALQTGGGPAIADAYTINGLPGPLYNCSSTDVFVLKVKRKKTYLLRIVNAALNTELFFTVANHALTVVETDGDYTKPLLTNSILLTPGQSTNVLIKTDQPIGRYYMGASPYMSASIPFQRVPTLGLGTKPCDANRTSTANITASMSNISLILPGIALLQAYYFNISNVFSADFPDSPLNPFNYTGSPPNNFTPESGTRVNVIPLNSSVQMVLQDTSILGVENHPIHLHGYSFYVVGQGFGNFNESTANFNLVDPPRRNTIGVPVGRWAALRFKADNPGVWYMHCHLEIHTTWRLLCQMEWVLVKRYHLRRRTFLLVEGRIRNTFVHAVNSF